MKDLGRIIDRILSWTEHIDKVLAKSRSLVNMFRFLRKYLEQEPRKPGLRRFLKVPRERLAHSLFKAMLDG